MLPLAPVPTFPLQYPLQQSVLCVHRRPNLGKLGCENIVRLRELVVCIVAFECRRRSPIRVRVKWLVNIV